MSIQGDVPAILPEATPKTRQIIDTLVGYKREAESNRKSGMNPRDDKWRQNLDLYWNRYDFSEKAAWQSKNVMPEVPSYVDRFAAALKEALVATPNGFYTVTDPYDTENNLTQPIKNMTDVWLSSIGRNQIGQTMDFSTVFEEQVKLGALMNMSAVVLWKDDVPGGRVAIETVDPRFIWMDHTYRNLYRIRRTEIDMADLARMATSTSAKGKPLYNLSEMNRLVGTKVQDRQEQRELTGNGEEVVSERKPIILDEYIASVVDDQGQLIMDNEVVIVADDTYLIRGPEKNPFWHGKDWLVYTPLMPVPMSPYGRSYMEDFGSTAKVFNDMTNLILDSVYMSGMKAFAMVPSMLTDPTQAATGVWPNKTFMLEEGYGAEDFLKAIDLGRLDAGAVQIWQAIKSELSDAAGMNEIGLGQLPDKTHIAATAVAGAQQSSSMITRSIAQTIETRFLDPMLDLVWKTGLQHAQPNDMRMSAAVGDQWYPTLIGQRKELIKRPITFQARGISALIQKQQKLQALLGVLQIIAQNPNLMQAFMQRVDIKKFVDLLFNLTNVDISKLEPTQRDQLIASVAGPMAGIADQATQGSAATPTTVGSDLATSMGVAK